MVLVSDTIGWLIICGVSYACGLRERKRARERGEWECVYKIVWCIAKGLLVCVYKRFFFFFF